MLAESPRRSPIGHSRHKVIFHLAGIKDIIVGLHGEQRRIADGLPEAPSVSGAHKRLRQVRQYRPPPSRDWSMVAFPQPRLVVCTAISFPGCSELARNL